MAKVGGGGGAPDPDYGAMVTQENEFINHRMGWLLTSQSIFFTGYVLAPAVPRSQQLIDWLPKLGLLITLLIYLSIFAAVVAIAYYHFKRTVVHGHESFQVVGPIAPALLPLVIGGTWLWIINEQMWTVIAIGGLALYILLMLAWLRPGRA